MLSNIMAAIAGVTGRTNKLERKIVADSVAFTLDLLTTSVGIPKVVKIQSRATMCQMHVRTIACALVDGFLICYFRLCIF